MRRRILMLVAPKEFFEPEYSVPRTLFSGRGIDVAVATSGKEATGAQGTTIKADLDVEQTNVKDFDALFVVGGKGMIEFSGDKAAKRILRKFVRAGKPVALICHAPLLAAKAKVVTGRQMTGWPEIRPEMVAAGAKWTGMPVERDGDLFTAVGPEDAELLADILARRMDGAPTLSEAVLDEAAAMRKLARLWRAADSLDKPMTDEEAERWLREFEREEFEGETESPVVRKPVAPVPRPTITPAPIKREPSPEEKLPQPPGGWGISLDLQPPRTDGAWPIVPETQPAGFPIAAEDLKDGKSIRALFQKPETWTALREAAANPMKRGLIQSYFVPMIVLALGKSWWEINKRRKQIGGAPFGLFSSKEYKTLQDAEVAMEDTTPGRAIIAQINWHVAKIIQHHLATGGPGPTERFDGYIYRALHNIMVTETGKRHGFEYKPRPTCAYCEFKRVIRTTSPFLSETVKHRVQEEGARRQRPMYKCPTCADLIETKEQELRLKEQGVHNAEESLRNMGERVRDGYARIEAEPDNKEIQTRLETRLSMWESYKPQVAVLAKERDDLRAEIDNRRRMLSTPYHHIGCANENCPRHSIPLTFVDWESPYWTTPEGVEARRRLASIYGVVEPGTQKAEDTPVEEPPTAERRGKTPPEWMWNVPFRCPFDGTHFTPQSAFGHGKLGDDGRTRTGGLFVKPPHATVWWKPLSLDVPDRTEEDAKRQRIEETRTQTGIDTTTDSDQFLSDQNEKMYYAELADALRQEFYRRREIHGERTKGVRGNRTAKLEALLYDALLEWSFVHPLHLVGYFTKRMPSTRRVLDKETGEVRKHLEIRSLNPGGAEQIVSSLIQTWFTKVLERSDGWRILQPYLASENLDKVPPRGYFVSVVRRNSAGDLEAPCGLRYSKGSPIGEKPPRGSSYQRDIYMALVEGIWDYPGTPDTKDTITPLSPERGDALAKGMTSRLDEMENHNSQKIVFDSATSLVEGSPILVKALFMPRHTAWVPIKRVMHLRKDLADPEDDMAGIMDVVGRLADNRESDVRMFARWRKALRQLGMPEQVKKFDEALRKRMEEKGMKRSEASLRAEAKDPLAKYKGKREFDETPEPEGKEAEGANKHRFVIQLHHAKKAGDHYDLRLENDEGALSSWSIPKHRLPKGKEKLLAVRTEDHPVKYLKFKGEIPAGYGAGMVEIHDSGTYEEIEAGKTKIVFKLKGKKEKGTYRLFRAGKGGNWLIMEGAGEKKAFGAPPLSKLAMKIEKGMIPMLWWENDKGERFVSEPDKAFEPPPEGFFYQHSQFPTTLHHHVLRTVVPEEVESCPHKDEHVRQTYGWIDGVEGRECAACKGSQTRRVGDPWPGKWDADGSRDFMSGSSGWSEDLALAMANSGGWKLGEAILIAANSCERCMNALAHRYGLEWGYPEFGEEWKKANTECDFCLADPKCPPRESSGEQVKEVFLSKTAAHSGAMLALMVPPAIARKMRKAKMVEDPELASELHMTLLYLGKAADLDKGTLAAIQRAAEKVCARHDPLEMGVSGAGLFTPGKDGTPVYVVPNAKGLSAFQADLENAIGSIVDLPSEHGWVPHMTVSYSCDDKPELPDLSEKLEWTADKVRLQAGGKKVADIPIGRRKKAAGCPPLSKRAEKTVIVLRGGEKKESFEYDERGKFRSWSPTRGADFDEQLQGLAVHLRNWPENKGELTGRFIVSRPLSDNPHLSLQFESELEDQRSVFAPLDQLVLPPDVEIVWAPGKNAEAADPLCRRQTVVAAMLSPPLSRRAALERLPIAADPVMWSDEQLVEAVARPELFGNDKGKYQAAVEQLAKRGLAKKMTPKDIGHWLERGRFMLFWGGSPLAIYRTREHAQRSRGALVNDFAEHATFPAFVDGGQKGWEHLISGDISYEVGSTVGDYKESVPWINQELFGRLLNPKISTKDRKEYAESALNIVKLPIALDIQDKDCADGDKPGAKDSVVAREVFQKTLRMEPGEDEDPYDEDAGDISADSRDSERTGRNTFIDQTVNTVRKRLDAQRAGLDPENLADDDALELALIEPEQIPLSRHAAAVGMACPHCHTDVSKLEPERTPTGLYKMMTCPECKGAFYPQDALVAAKETGKRELGVDEWPERGWFLLMVGTKPMGFIDGEAAARAALGRWTDKVAKGDWGDINLGSVANRALSKVEDMLRDPFGKPSLGGRTLWELAKRQGIGLDKRLDELMKHPMYEKTRRELAGRIGNLVPMPPGFKPAPESRIAGFPTDENAEMADVQIDSLLGHLDDIDDAHKQPAQRRFKSSWDDAEAKSNDAFNDMAKEMAKPVAKRLKWLLEQREQEIKVPKPEDMADDFPISKRVETYQ